MIQDAGGEGILQMEMWKTLGVCSREASRIALKLLERGSIERLKELHEGRWTYRLFSTMKPATIDSIRDCPCMVCCDIERCTTGPWVSPRLCKKLTYWIDLKTANEHVSPDDFHEDNV